jgi:hypothetical protein
MIRTITLMVAAVLVVVVLATGALPAYAQSSDPGPVGWRFLSNQWAYCDNFYGSDHVYWCHSDLYGGYWFRVSSTF